MPSELETQLYTALKAMPCRCQMVGGAKWHFRALPEVAKQCSRCVALAAYEAQEDGQA
jgi:hypothetical protein